jgi:hypothetical protein
MPKKRTQTGRRTTSTLPEEHAEEANVIPTATAVAAEAMATGVIPLEAQHRHADEKEIPGQDEILSMGDADSHATANAFVGDETPVGDMPAPDQNQVDDIGRAMGVQEADSGALRTSSEILDRRDQHRGYLEVPEPNPETRRR